jgi:hypothetical protein
MTITSEDVRQLQESLLRAILLGHSLPGETTTLSMPDLQFVTAGESILLLDENLVGPISIGASEKPLRIIGRQALQSTAEAKQGGYLRFHPVEVGQDTVQMSLEASMLTAATGAELGLSTVRVEFRNAGGGWVAGSPTFSAM